MRIVFFGTPLFAASYLGFLIDEGVEVVAVVSRPDKPVGRSGTPVHTPVKALALQHEIPVFQPEKASDPELAEALRSLQPDFFVVIAYGEILKQNLLDIPRLASINVHGSLLPKYRGAAPIQRCLINGDSETGVTIMHMVRKMDAGDIIKQARVPILPSMNAADCEHALIECGKQPLLESLRALVEGKATRTPQEESCVTYAPKIEEKDLPIDWRNSALSIHHQIRALSPRPCAWSSVIIGNTQKRFKILESAVGPSVSTKEEPGTTFSTCKSELYVHCGLQSSLVLVKVQLEGKRAMSIEEFLRGYPSQTFKFLIG